MANANYQPSSSAAPYMNDDGNRVVYSDVAAVAANLATTDKVRPVRIPAGTKVDRVVINNADLDSGANLAVNIGFSYTDGSTAPGNGATHLASAATTWQAAATTTYEVFPPIVFEKEGYIECVPTVGGVGTGSVYAKVEGENVGAK